MIVEIEVKEKWEIGEKPDAGGFLQLRRLGDTGWYSYAGYWAQHLPTNPQLRAAVERQWNRLRPLADDEWRGPNGNVLQFRMVGDRVELRVLPGGGFVRLIPGADPALVTAAEAFKARELAKRAPVMADDEGIDPTTREVRKMAINEARNPETREIVRLREIPPEDGQRRFGGAGYSIRQGDKHANLPIHTRCIAYRDHVLELERQLKELKGQ